MLRSVALSLAAVSPAFSLSAARAETPADWTASNVSELVEIYR